MLKALLSRGEFREIYSTPVDQTMQLVVTSHRNIQRGAQLTFTAQYDKKDLLLAS